MVLCSCEKGSEKYMLKKQEILDRLETLVQVFDIFTIWLISCCSEICWIVKARTILTYADFYVDVRKLPNGAGMLKKIYRNWTNM